MKFTHERKELVAVDGGLNVEIESVFELTLGDLAALELDKVDTGCIEARHDAEEGSGAVRDIYHNAGTVGT